MIEPSPPCHSPWRDAVRAGLHAARANLLPGVVLNAVALALVLAYFLHPGTQAALGEVKELKERWGYGFAALSTALFGGLLPFLLHRALGGGRQAWSLLAWTLPFWAVKGLEVNGLYDLQGHVFGAEPSPGVVALKVLIDQGVYVTLWAAPTQTLFYRWLELDRRWPALAAELGRGWYARACLPVLITNWCLWTPAVTLVYCLPVPLQLPVQNLILCLWVLLLTVLTGRKAAT
jgi:hypothetical protein